MSTSAADRAWVCTRKGLFEMRHGSTTGWRIARSHFLGEPVSAVLPPLGGGGRMFAALNLGHFGAKLQVSDDAGGTWRELPAPAYPEQPPGAEGAPWKLVQIWTLESACDASRLWLGTLPGGLFASLDHGETWQLDRSLWDRPERTQWMGGGNEAPGLHSICPHPSRPDELLIGVSCGGAWRRSKAGSGADADAVWALRARGMRADFMPPELAEDENSQDPHRIQRCAAEPDVLWCQHHCGIFRSVDNGARWQPVDAQPSSFGFAVAAHPQRGDTAWFVPAVKDERRLPVDGALCVTRTQDGGAHFEALREGLPQQDCHDLVYRHGLDVAASDPRRLLMGSTTGHLWASGDGGESWRLVAGHLPPIYGLRFG
ncbi:MAG: exo-alpha-sialidase [Rubrivivax sp.]|jgi:photosystem II stability/assembly factor-like uncharacterized protein